MVPDLARLLRRVSATVIVVLLVSCQKQDSSAEQPALSVPQDPSAVGYLNLHQRHPDADPGPDEFDRAYSSEKAIERLDQVRGFMESFRKLTDRSRRSVSKGELEAIGNTGRDMQTIGFHNIPLVIEGTILKQEYQLTQLKYQVAQLAGKQGPADSQELDRAKSAYAEAARKLQEFWDKKLPTD